MGESAQAAEAALGWKWLLVGGGGTVGSILRFEVSRWCASLPHADRFPIGTFAANVIGSFVLGLAAALILHLVLAAVALDVAEQVYFFA